MGHERKTVLFVTSNGEGLGHLTRMMAVARRCSPAIQPVFLTMSESFPIVARQGFPVEYFPYWRRSGLRARDWWRLFEQRLDEVVGAYDAQAVMFDGVRPYPTFNWIRQRHPQLRLIWSRRGMWKNPSNPRSLHEESSFDLVIEPRDAGGVMDSGRTVGRFEPPVHAVAPVTLLDPGEMAGREEAREALGLPSSGPAVLVQLSCNDTAELVEATERASKVIRAVHEDASVFSAQHPLHAEDTVRMPEISSKPIYPLARYLNAFDFAVSGAGYNSFHELLAAAVPTLFVPKPDVRVDDQRGRARFSAIAGFGTFSARYDVPEFDRSLRRLLTVGTVGSRRMAVAAKAVREENGAAEAARVLESFVRSTKPPGRDSPPRPVATHNGRRSPTMQARTPQLQRLTSGAYIDQERAVAAQRGLFVALDHGGQATEDLADGIAALQSQYRDFQPIVVTRSSATSRLRYHGILYERIMPHGAWQRLSAEPSYSLYVADRLRSIVDMYAPDFRVDLTSGDALTVEELQRARFSRRPHSGPRQVDGRGPAARRR